MKAQVLVPHRSILGEGAWYDWKRDVLIWLDIFGQEIHEYDTKRGLDVCHKVELPVTTIVPSRSGYILGTREGVKFIDKTYTEMKDYAHNPAYDYANHRCNDGKCGPDGRFYIGLMECDGAVGDGALWACDDKSCVKVLDNLDVPNGIVWSRDGKKMYFTDTLNATVFEYDLTTGMPIKGKAIFHAENGMTDGMTIDENDELWIAVWGSSCVYHVDPATCKVLDVVETTAPQVSSVAIAHGRIYITSATSGMSEEELAKYPDSGSLFIADVPVQGLEAFRYNF